MQGPIEEGAIYFDWSKFFTSGPYQGASLIFYELVLQRFQTLALGTIKKKKEKTRFLIFMARTREKFVESRLGPTLKTLNHSK